MTDVVLIAVIITIAILAFGGISVLVILLFMKWKGYMKTRNRGTIQVAELDRERTQTRGQYTRARPRNRNNIQTDQNGSGEPPPYTEQTEYPPLYTVDDSGTPRNLRTGAPDATTNQEQDDTIAFSPPPPYTVLPPRLLLTRESIARSSVNTIASLNHIGPETNSIANTPLLQHAPTTRLFTALENIRNPSARGSSGRHVNSAHSSISAGLRQPVHVTPNTLRRASRAQQSRQQATTSNANSNSGTERR